MVEQGFRKYVHKATDHEELLAFLLGQLVKEKVQLYIYQHHGKDPERVSIPLSSLDTRVSLTLDITEKALLLISRVSTQAKELEIYDVSSFLRSKLFTANGYRFLAAERAIEKVFSHVAGDEL
jgi:DNA replication licensing factor MCM2